MILQAGHRLAILSDVYGVHLAMHSAADRERFCVVPMDPQTPEDELRAAMSKAHVDCVVSDRTHAALAHRSTQGRPTMILEDDGSPAHMEPGRLGPPQDDDAYCVVRTTGTSGHPKWVTIGRKQVVAHRGAAMRRLECDHRSVWLACLPMHHMGGIALMDRCLHGGGRVVSMDRFDAEAAHATMRKHHVTHISVVPTMLRRLLAAPCPDDLQCVLVGGDRLPAGLAREALDAGWPIFATYGLTEACSQVATATPDELRSDHTTVGTPLDGVKVSIIEGEIVVDGPTVTDGPVHTGDLGEMRHGRLYVTGRLDDRIITGGENVDPIVVEQALLDAGAWEAAVFGVPDDEWGQRVVALVTGQTASTTLRDRSKGSLPAYAVPKEIRAVTEIPRHGGKIDRRRLASAW